MWAFYILIGPVYIPSPYNVFLAFFEGQGHKDNKLGIVTNVGKSRLVKVIFTNIHKISNVCANSFNTPWLHSVWEMFLLFIKIKFLRKNGVSEKIKAHLPQHLQALWQLFSLHLFNFIQKNCLPKFLWKRGQRLCILYERLQRRDNKVIVILYDRFFIYRTVKSEHLKEIKKFYEKWYT